MSIATERPTAAAPPPPGGRPAPGPARTGWLALAAIVAAALALLLYLVSALLVSFVAFVLTFILTRTVTRMIRAGKGPFHNVSDGGVHLHHSTPGVALLVAGGFGAVGAQARSPWAYVAAALVGVGASLVLDEFAMIFHLEDDYWSQEGELSVNVVTLAAACIGLAVVGVTPVSGVDDTEGLVRGGVAVALVLHLLLVATTAFKGKYPTALIGLFAADRAVSRVHRHCSSSRSDSGSCSRSFCTAGVLSNFSIRSASSNRSSMRKRRSGANFRLTRCAISPRRNFLLRASAASTISVSRPPSGIT